jgi:DNA-directed RNA polymerase subunit beta'
MGLKENVIIGKLIPAGTGMGRYNDITIDVATLDHVPAALRHHDEEIDENQDEDMFEGEQNGEELLEAEVNVDDAPAPAVDDSEFDNISDGDNSLFLDDNDNPDQDV